MTIRIPLKWIILFLFLGIEALILRLFAVSPEKDRAVIAFGGTVVAGAFALFVYMQGVEAQQSRAADKLFERWNNPTMAAYKNTGRDIRRGILDPITLARTSQNVVFAEPQKTQRTELLGLLSFYEEICLAIRMRSANEEKLKRYFKAVLVQTFTKVKPFIDKERAVDNNLRYYIEFEEVFEVWKN
ncbi:MAG TPA: DUF4760 domain-containing protein [Bryobacteraceae bacterium]|jgi:hypothetical protein|nr:DUF4760 domain-containing protein [Bryobacteraceae bacterium]